MIEFLTKRVYWHLDLPEFYFKDFTDSGLVLGHIDDFQGLHQFSGKWEEYYKENFEDEGIIHSDVTLVISNNCRSL